MDFKKLTGRDRTRMIVRIRDNFTCQDCKSIRYPKQAKKENKRLYDIHHLNGLCGKKSHSYDRLSEISGLITLCHKCHFNRPEHKCMSKVFKENFIHKIVINGKIITYNQRNKEIKLMVKKGTSQTKAGEIYGLSKQRVSQLLKLP